MVSHNFGTVTRKTPAQLVCFCEPVERAEDRPERKNGESGSKRVRKASKKKHGHGNGNDNDNSAASHNSKTNLIHGDNCGNSTDDHESTSEPTLHVLLGRRVHDDNTDVGEGPPECAGNRDISVVGNSSRVNH
jgi:hypothetical protein